MFPYLNSPSDKYCVKTKVSDCIPVPWKAIEDTDSDFNMDSNVINKLFDTQDEGFWESNDILTASETRRFYAESPNAKLLRSYACRFVSEWGIKDLDAAIGKLKGRWNTYELKERIEPYQWWKEAKDAGCDVPESPLCWHYNPITFLQEMSDGGGWNTNNTRKTTVQSSEQGASCTTDWKLGFGRDITDQNKYNKYIAEAAEKYKLDCKILKSLIAQESGFKSDVSNNQGFAGLTQVGGAAIDEAGFNIGTTSKATGVWVFDPNDERFEPGKSIMGGALVLHKKRKRIDTFFLNGYKSTLTEDEQWAFYLAAYNGGEGTVRKAYKALNESNAKWNALIDGGASAALFKQYQKRGVGNKSTKRLQNTLRIY